MELRGKIGQLSKKKKDLYWWTVSSYLLMVDRLNKWNGVGLTASMCGMSSKIFSLLKGRVEGAFGLEIQHKRK